MKIRLEDSQIHRDLWNIHTCKYNICKHEKVCFTLSSRIGFATVVINRYQPDYVETFQHSREPCVDKLLLFFLLETEVKYFFSHKVMKKPNRRKWNGIMSVKNIIPLSQYCLLKMLRKFAYRRWDQKNSGAQAQIIKVANCRWQRMNRRLMKAHLNGIQANKFTFLRLVGYCVYIISQFEIMQKLIRKTSW